MPLREHQGVGGIDEEREPTPVEAEPGPADPPAMAFDDQPVSRFVRHRLWEPGDCQQPHGDDRAAARQARGWPRSRRQQRRQSRNAEARRYRRAGASDREAAAAS